MLAELAAANAAFQIIKQTVQNGRDIMSAGKSIASLVDAEEKLRTKGAKKKNSFWFKVGGKDGADLDEFMALQELAQKKKELESMMRLYSPPGTYDAWVKFQVQARKDRAAAEEKRKENMQKLLEVIAISVFCILGLGILGVVIYLALNTRGMI